MSSSSLIYAGVGSRETPAPILKSMELIGAQLADKWHLRSGYAPGADMAFGRGCESEAGSFEMYLPWEGFNSAPLNDERFVVPQWSAELLDIASRCHPTWDDLKDTVKCLMARNVAQVLGLDLTRHAKLVICYTPGGNSGGGTGQAIRVANLYGIPVFDLAREYDQKQLCEFVNSY